MQNTPIVEKTNITTEKKEKFVYKENLSKSQKRKLWIGRVVIWVSILVTLFPILAVLTASLSKGQSFTQGSILPKEISFDNYINVITKTDFLIWVKNSMIICFSVAIIQIAMTLPASFAFSKMKFKGRKNGLMFLLILQMFPSTMALSAILGIAYKLNAMDKIWALVLILCGGSAYNIWLLKGFIDGIPNDLIEAAKVDGATTWQAFTKVILPLTRNMLIVIFIFSFVGAYSEFVFSAALLKDPANQTITTGLRSFINNKFSANWTQYSAAAIMASAPILVIFMITNKYIAKGLVAGSVKG